MFPTFLQEIIDVVRSASGWRLSKNQATYTWDDTIHPYGKKLGLLTGYVKPQTGTSKRTAAGSPELQKKWHIMITTTYEDIMAHNTALVGRDKARQLMAHLIFNMDEECLLATGKNIRIVGSADKKKHDNERGSSRDSITIIRCGNAANRSAATFFLLVGKKKNQDYSDHFLAHHGAAEGSTIIMTESAFLNIPAWRKLVPKLSSSIRQIVEDAAKTFGIDGHTASKLKAMLALDGFKAHFENEMLVVLADLNILCACESRDSSAINQAFDKFVARAGKKRAARVIAMMARSHVVPIIDQWHLVLVGLAMLRDCSNSNVWQNSFIAVNMHPEYRLDLDDWLKKIAPAVNASDKFEKENVNLSDMLPKQWKETDETTKVKWLELIEEHNESWDVELIQELRAAGMNLQLLKNVFKLYHAEKTIRAGGGQQPTEEFVTPPKQIKTKHSMIYHIYNPGNDSGMSPLQKFEHAIAVRNRTLGPKKAITVSPYLDVHITDDNKKFLDLTDDDVNMHRVLQDSMCKHGFRRKVAKRTLTALGSASGQCRLLNDASQVAKLKENLKFAESLEQIRHQERTRKESAAKQKEIDNTAKAAAKVQRANKKNLKMKALVEKARSKLGIAKDAPFKARHVKSLTADMLQAIAFVYHQARLNGRVDNKRDQLKLLLQTDKEGSGTDDDQDETEAVSSNNASATSSDSDEECTEREDMTFDTISVGDIVEVYWKGMKQWYEGEVTGIDKSDRTVEVYYKSDGGKLYHSLDDYRIRLAE